MLDLRYWDMCGDTSKKGFSETFCSWYLDSFYIKPILLDTLFSKFVVYLFCNKHSSNNTRQNDCSLSTISLPIFKVDRVGGWLSLWVGLRKKKKFPGINRYEPLLNFTYSVFTVSIFQYSCAQNSNLYHLQTWCYQDFQNNSEGHSLIVKRTGPSKSIIEWLHQWYFRNMFLSDLSLWYVVPYFKHSCKSWKNLRFQYRISNFFLMR